MASCQLLSDPKSGIVSRINDHTIARQHSYKTIYYLYGIKSRLDTSLNSLNRVFKSTNDLAAYVDRYEADADGRYYLDGIDITPKLIDFTNYYTNIVVVSVDKCMANDKA